MRGRSRGWRSASALLPVDLVDLARPVLLDRLALHFHRGRQLARRNRELARQDTKPLDLLELRQVPVQPLDDFRIQRNDVVAEDERVAVGGRTAQLLQPALERGEVRNDQRGGEAATVAE